MPFCGAGENLCGAENTLNYKKNSPFPPPPPQQVPEVFWFLFKQDFRMVPVLRKKELDKVIQLVLYPEQN